MNRERAEKHFLPEWIDLLEDYLLGEKGEQLFEKIKKRYKTESVSPDPSNVFRVFKETKPEDIKVLLLGQDPYIDNNALGRAFAIPDKARINPSLLNLLEEATGKLHTHHSFDMSLQGWVEQGVFLLNTALTVKKGASGTHMDMWAEFTRVVIQAINRKGITAILLGNHAKSYEKFMSNMEVRKAGHPSPLNTSVPFKGTKIFKDLEIDWNKKN